MTNTISPAGILPVIPMSVLLPNAPTLPGNAGKDRFILGPVASAPAFMSGTTVPKWFSPAGVQVDGISKPSSGGGDSHGPKNPGGKKVLIREYWEEKGVGFGTSGLRAHESKLTDEVVWTSVVAMIDHFEEQGTQGSTGKIGFAMDLRDSSPRIAAAVARAIRDKGYQAVNLGEIPTPAMAYYSVANGMPSFMVTASHNPADNNGVKPYHIRGEVLKSEEDPIKAKTVEIPNGLFDVAGKFIRSENLPPSMDEARQRFISRYVDYYGSDALSGMKVIVFQHKAVGRDMIVEALERMGAQVIPIGRTEQFVQVDTEAVSDDVRALALSWAREHVVDAIVTMDPDSDRPMVAGGDGQWLVGDVLDAVVAKSVAPDLVVLTASCSNACSELGLQTVSTKIGSPFVIDAMMDAVGKGLSKVFAFERNGGVLHTGVERGGRRLEALWTRDSFLPILEILRRCRSENTSIVDLVRGLSATDSTKILVRDNAAGRAMVSFFQSGDAEKDLGTARKMFANQVGADVLAIDYKDGVKISFSTGDVIHIRLSGNAPEVRLYVGATTPERRKELLAIGFSALESLAKG